MARNTVPRVERRLMGLRPELCCDNHGGTASLNRQDNAEEAIGPTEKLKINRTLLKLARDSNPCTLHSCTVHDRPSKLCPKEPFPSNFTNHTYTHRHSFFPTALSDTQTLVPDRPFRCTRHTLKTLHVPVRSFECGRTCMCPAGACGVGAHASSLARSNVLAIARW